MLQGAPMRRDLFLGRGLTGYVRIALPWQLGCPHAHITSVWPLRPSQCGLQNFDLSAGTQLQAGFAHFFASDMDVSFADSPHLRPEAATSKMPGSEHAQVGGASFFSQDPMPRESASTRRLIAGTKCRCLCRIPHNECEDMKNDGSRSLLLLVGETGIEPVTLSLEDVRLRYSPVYHHFPCHSIESRFMGFSSFGVISGLTSPTP
jgi:hypothetical protein